MPRYRRRYRTAPNRHRPAGPSRSASSRQPVADKHIFDFEEYTTADGKPALSAKMHIRDMAAYYAEHPLLQGGYEYSWSSGGGNQYVGKIEDADAALDAIAGFTFPANIKREAMRSARYLAQTFENVAKIARLHNLTSGRLDRRKLPRIARHTATDTYDVNVIRPYRRTLPQPIKTPTLAIVASAGNMEMWRDSSYVPRVVTLTLSVLWACEAAGLHAYAALMQGHGHVDQSHYSQAIQAILLAEPNHPTPPRVYAVALHRDLWRYGLWTTRTANYDDAQTLAAAGADSCSASRAPYWFACRNGGHGVRWAREILDADLVLSIGAQVDRDEADIAVETSMDVSDAVQSIATQARTLKSGN